MKHKTSAFSIVELIIVLAVIGILAAILIPVFSNIIEKSNAKSALSDAKNAVTSYNIAFDSNNEKDSVFMVEKANKMYVFGYYLQSKQILACAFNPMPLQGYNELLEQMLLQNQIKKSGNEQEDVTAKIHLSSNNLAVYSGYTLLAAGESILLNNNRLDMEVGTSQTLSAQVLPSLENAELITWKSENEEIATVNNGVVTAVSKGSTTVYAECGTLKGVCEVNVGEWIEFDGDIKAFKKLVEDKKSPLGYIKLTENISVDDMPNIFPIVIPKGKVVHLDMCISGLYYAYSNASGYISSMFLIDGGSLYISSSGDGSGREGDYGQIVLFNSSSDDGTEGVASKGNVIDNTNGGFLYLGKGVDFAIRTSSHEIASGYAIYNIDSTVICEGTYFSGSNKSGNATASIYNGKNSKLTIKKASFRFGESPYIVNYGTIDVIENVTCGNSTQLIENYGFVGRISNCTFRTSKFERKGIVCSGENAIIQEIRDCIFSFEYRPPMYDMPIDSSTAIEFTNGATLGEIKNCETNAAIPIICDDTVKIIVGVSSGKFSKPIDEKYLATGRTCVYNEEEQMYIVQ